MHEYGDVEYENVDDYVVMYNYRFHLFTQTRRRDPTKNTKVKKKNFAHCHYTSKKNKKAKKISIRRFVSKFSSY